MLTYLFQGQVESGICTFLFIAILGRAYQRTRRVLVLDVYKLIFWISECHKYVGCSIICTEWQCTELSLWFLARNQYLSKQACTSVRFFPEHSTAVDFQWQFSTRQVLLDFGGHSGPHYPALVQRFGDDAPGVSQFLANWPVQTVCEVSRHLRRRVCGSYRMNGL